MLEAKSISFYRNKQAVIKNISLKIAQGEQLAIMGASGCGKSTLLQLLYGLHNLDKGSITYNNEPILGPDFHLIPGHNQMKYLAQDFDLMPFLSVSENIAHYLSAFYPIELEKRTADLLEMIEMQPFKDRMVNTLSGGQQQRVAIARVLAQEPKVLLLDEPFGHIDNFKKNKLRRNLFTYAREKNISCVIASHDVNDVLPFADAIILIKDHSIYAQGTPKELYSNPPNLEVASLFSDANLIPIHLLKPYAQVQKELIIYPQELEVSEKSGLEVTISNRYYKGSYYLYEGEMMGGKNIFFTAVKHLEIAKTVFLNVPLEILTQRLGNRPS